MCIKHLYKGFLCVMLAWLAGCTASTREQVEVKAADGVVERYERRKRDFAKDGLYQKMYASGTLAESANYRGDTLHGECIFYFPNGKTERAETYVAGVLHGTFKQYREDGSLFLEQQFANGALEGLSLRYYPNGQLEEQVTLRQNEENGPFIEYYPNGKIKTTGTYIYADETALEQGELREYDSTGVLVRIANCERGVCLTKKTAADGQ
jgi:antitoxin component YwqK of YwqJK toxin-antitoxin module